MNQFLTLAIKLSPGFILVLVIFILTTCTPPEPAFVQEWKKRKNGDYFVYPLVNNADKYQAIMDMPTDAPGNYMKRDTTEDLKHYFENYCRKRFSLSGYGWISAGKPFKTKRHEPDYSPFKIENDYLLFLIRYEGSLIHSSGFKCLELVWDEKYETTPEGHLIANVVICFSHFSNNPAYGRQWVAFDLLPLQSADTNEIYINFQGYDKLIRYSY
jgi:hypothetical protein